VTTSLKPKVGAPFGGIRAAITLLLLVPVLVPLFAAALIWISERDADREGQDKVSAAARIVSADVRALVTTGLDRLRRLDDELGPDPAGFLPHPDSPGEGFFAIYDA
jgi:hypothetical protein